MFLMSEAPLYPPPLDGAPMRLPPECWVSIVDLTDLYFVFIVDFICANFRGASLGNKLSGGQHGPITVWKWG